MSVRFPALFLIPVLVAAHPLAWADRVVSGCDSPSWLASYDRAGLLKRLPDGTLQFTLVADLHAADCGAPDCYGTKISISMKPLAGQTACDIHEASVTTTDYFEEGCGPFNELTKTRQEPFYPESGRFDLQAPAPVSLTLRSRDGRRAIVLLPDNFFYFDRVDRDGVLHLELASDDDDDNRCCWGATSSRLKFGNAP